MSDQDQQKLFSAGNMAELGAACEALRHVDADKLGFIPEASYKKALGRGKLLTAHLPPIDAIKGSDRYEITPVNELVATLCGYLLWTHVRDELKIQQCVVAEPRRRSGWGTRMVHHLCNCVPPWTWITFRVREDLEANAFWRFAGFRLLATINEQRNGKSTINRWGGTAHAVSDTLFQETRSRTALRGSDDQS